MELFYVGIKSLLKNECGKTNICFINNSNITPRYHINQRGIHLNKSETNRLIDNLLFALSKLTVKGQVSMSTNVHRETSNFEKQFLSKKNAKETFKT